MTKIKLTVGPEITFAAVLGCTPEQNYMQKAFALVCPSAWGKGDWEGAVSAVLTNADLAAVGVTLQDVVEAVLFMTATEATVRRSQMLNGELAYIIQAAGYRAGPAN